MFSPSYVTLYLEAESAYMQNMQVLSQLKHRSRSNLSNFEKEKCKESVILDKNAVSPDSKTGGMSSIVCFL